MGFSGPPDSGTPGGTLSTEPSDAPESGPRVHKAVRCWISVEPRDQPGSPGSSPRDTPVLPKVPTPHLLEVPPGGTLALMLPPPSASWFPGAGTTPDSRDKHVTLACQAKPAIPGLVQGRQVAEGGRQQPMAAALGPCGEKGTPSARGEAWSGHRPSCHLSPGTCLRAKPPPSRAARGGVRRDAEDAVGRLDPAAPEAACALNVADL